MKFFLLLLAALPAIAQDCTINFRFSAAGDSSNFDNRTRGCVTWSVTYTSTGFTALSITVQGAPDSSGSPGAFGTVAAASGSNPNTAITQASTTFSTYFPWIRVNLAGLAGSGSITGTLYGWRIGAQSGATSSGGSGSAVFGPDAAGAAPTQPPVQIGLFDGTNVRRILGTSAGRLVNTEKTVSTALADDISNTAVVPQGDNSGDTVPYRPSLLHSFDGTNWDRLRSAALNGIFVQGSTANGATPTGTFAPVVIGGRRFGGTSDVQTLEVDTQGNIGLQGGSAGLADNDSNSVVSAAAGDTNGAVFAGRLQVFDPLASNWDRMRGSDAGLLVAGFSTGNAGTIYSIMACDSSAVINVAAAATTELVALTASRRVRVCAFTVSGDTAATTAQFVYGTGTNCGTGTTNLTGAMRLQDEGGISIGSGTGELFKTALSNALCLTAATGAVTGFVTYALF